MTTQEAIDTIKLAIAQIEWDYPMDYAAAFDMAVDALERDIEEAPLPYIEDTNYGQFEYYKCAVCNGNIDEKYKYCPYCGKAVKQYD